MASLVKMQVYLDQTQYVLFKNMAKKLGVSMAQLIREWIDEKSQSRKKTPLTIDPFWKCVGKGDSGKEDIAQHFNDYLYGGNLSYHIQLYFCGEFIVNDETTGKKNGSSFC